MGEQKGQGLGSNLSVRSIPRAKLHAQRVIIHRGDILRSQPPLLPRISASERGASRASNESSQPVSYRWISSRWRWKNQGTGSGVGFVVACSLRRVRDHHYKRFKSKSTHVSSWSERWTIFPTLILTHALPSI